ncbi:MAG: Holliday junction resolvase RuvX [Cellvibrionales bacterium]|nr:Holliday junction resolvase RuvX [Porticoccaceae bacterium]|tara:strand:+ start:10297 stop:10734 length:438 start_codon:yes stop_codon:yes gene_type:complete
MLNAASVKNLLGFDFGTAQIGIATGQTVTSTATSLAIITARNGIPDWRALGEIISEWQPELMVVGLPLNMDDSESELSQRARKFARRLHGRFNIDTLMMDERLTSREAKAAHRHLGKRDLDKVDHIAAALILQSWLDQPQLGQRP